MKKLYFVLMAAFVGISAVYAQAGDPLFILFPPYSADLTAVDAEQAIENAEAFTGIAQILVDNPNYRILVDGHANPVLGSNREEVNTLRPLSLRRAEAAAAFLVQYYNVDANRLIVNGAGGRYSPDTNLDRSYSRRVSFVVIQPQ